MNNKKNVISKALTTTLTLTTLLSPVSVIALENNRGGGSNLGNIQTYATNGPIEINETNFPDPVFRQYVIDEFDTDTKDGKLSQDEITSIKRINLFNKTNIKDLTGIQYFTNLTYLDCRGTGISTLDVSQNKALKQLNCALTRIEDIDISQNIALTSLACNNTRISFLDVTQNEGLESLSCDNTKIKSLDVSQQKNLKVLDCRNTGIESLDVSKNTVLDYLDCHNCSLTWLNIGNNANLTYFDKSDSNIELEVSEDTFHITDKFVGIDKSKVTIVSGADYDDTTGIVSDYKSETPITYTYNCGTSYNNTPETLTVTLNLKGYVNKSTISIQEEDLSKTYDGIPVKDYFTVTKTGSTGDVTYLWEKKNNDGTWEVMASAPKDVGTYRVSAILAGDGNYREAKSDAMFFTIEPKLLDANHITVPDITSETNLDNLVIKDGEKTLKQGTDYDVIKTQDGNTDSVKIQLKGNYSGNVIKTYTVKESITIEEEAPNHVDKDKPNDENKATDDINKVIDNEKENIVKTYDNTCIEALIVVSVLSSGLFVYLKNRKEQNI